MHTIQPARLKPGVSLDTIPEPASSAAETASAPIIRGRALIFWDLKVLGRKKKLDAIDTDQITPAADCVSESLETLDERWKAGSFRYLMPDFRARVHRGETFLVAGDRFAIGSSREMSPAGLKAIAEEVGREIVIVPGPGPVVVPARDQPQPGRARAPARRAHLRPPAPRRSRARGRPAPRRRRCRTGRAGSAADP